ncbi:Dyp-type peroxidase [Campylobacter geochelonis]|uniref:Dyp-type peroxidase n=1 Tax=Campylobacter geochelonis TaxID=1780362 RepID=UPI000770AC26|nr:Dyp-type peroxidase [Campylobacter geochelonis]CZE50160.1 Dyp-type peroxidase [Campylobacter geochelonis]
MKHGFNTQAVTSAPGEHAKFMVLSINDSKDSDEKVKNLTSNFSALVRSMRNRYPDLEVSGVMGFGANAFKRLFPDIGTPKELKVFEPIKGKRFEAVSTPGDLFFHLRAKKEACIFELSTNIMEQLDGAVVCEDEVSGFRYFDGRAIVGFVDGTENPDFDKDSFAVIGEEDAKFAGGSYAFVQKYIHDMKKWNAMSVEEQEKTIGRRKFDDVELDDETKPVNAHNAVTNIEDEDGNELKIIRANMPFANPAKGEFGTYFIGYARHFSTTKKMLENMFVGEPVGNTDLLLEISTPVTGTLFYVPTFDFLDEQSL